MEVGETCPKGETGKTHYQITSADECKKAIEELCLKSVDNNVYEWSNVPNVPYGCGYQMHFGRRVWKEPAKDGTGHGYEATVPICLIGNHYP